MGSEKILSRALKNVEEYVLQLKKYSSNGKHPVTDDSVTLHWLQENLELCLMTGFIEKADPLGQKETYWNYICACFMTSEKEHDGISFVKSSPQFKTSLGCGQAFIRFCLTKKYLADTLQSCFTNQMISREFYSEKSLIMQEKVWSSLVTSLHKLNELDFDLNVGCPKNDAVWSGFSRKMLSPAENENISYKQIYTSEDGCDASEDNHSVLKLDELNSKFKKSDSLLKEVECLKKENLVLQSVIQKLQDKCSSLQKHLKCKCDGCFNKSVEDLESLEVKGSSLSFSDCNIKATVSSACKTSDESALSCKSHNVNSSADLPNQNITGDLKKNIEPTYNSLNLCSKSTEALNANLCLSPNSDYFVQTVFEFKKIISDIEDCLSKSDISAAAVPISHLKNATMSLEEMFCCETKIASPCLNFNNFIGNFISYFKVFISKQESVINAVLEKIDSSILQNHSLYSSIITLKDLMRSYGFLKVAVNKDVEHNNNLLPPFDVNSDAVSLPENVFSDCVANDPVFKAISISLVPLFNSVSKKLHGISEKLIDLQFGLTSTQELNNNLISRVQAQEIHLKGVTKELEEAQRLLSVMKQQHKKLQSAEGIIKYDLQEKRKLLTRLKQQLENTHDDFNLVRIKNSESEAEWKDLRKEFVLRHKQTSEESGFEDNESAASNAECISSISDEVSENTNASDAYETSFQDKFPKKRRLDLLEEQCQNIFSRLLQSSKRHVDIDKHLDVMCKKIEKSTKPVTKVIDVPSNLETSVSTSNVSNIPSDDICQNVSFTENLAASPHSHSDVGSLCIPGISSNATSFDGSCDSSKLDLSISPLKFHIESNQVNSSTADDKKNVIIDSESISCNVDKNDELLASSIQSLGISNVAEKDTFQDVSLSHVDSLLIKKKDLEESLKVLEIDNEFGSDKISYLDSKEENEVSELEEKKWLLNKVEELEKNNLILSNELETVTQQLTFSNTSKEHEVAALQLQLNTEVLKYETNLKEFREQSQSLESMKQKIAEQEDFIQAFEEALGEIQLGHENEKKQQWQELEDIHIVLEAREQECDALFQDLEQSVCDLKREKLKNELLASELKKLEEYNQREKECAEAELIDLKNISRELKKRLVKLVKEKDLLWKRSNDLYHLQKLKMNDRWMSDSEVSTCLGCKNTFSFLMRKHHCRICGRIFCYSCSNNWLLTAASSKKLRTCNECFAQYIEIKNEVRRGSDVPHVDDSDDDEACDVSLSLNITDSSSLICGTSSSINDSVISLPFLQKQSTPLSASAPNLCCVVKKRLSESQVHNVNLEENVKDKIFKLGDDAISMDIEHHNESEISSDDCTSVTIEASAKSDEL